jgi:16S rRNA (cytidine1402-2'-O)-methyltransferase
MPLYIVATPIGNLEDITLRALRVLKEADLILCEDTRVTRKLLMRHGIDKPLLSYHQHSRLERYDEIKRLLAEGKSLALVSDAGTPGINDPGNELIAFLSMNCSIEQTADKNVRASFAVIPVPGPNAAAAALSVSGFPSDRFLFLGFPPMKHKRRQFFSEIRAQSYATIFYESSHRILKTLGELESAIGARPLIVAREITKQFETVYRGTAREIAERLEAEKAARGEFVVVAAPKGKEVELPDAS